MVTAAVRPIVPIGFANYLLGRTEPTDAGTLNVAAPYRADSSAHVSQQVTTALSGDILGRIYLGVVTTAPA